LVRLLASNCSHFAFQNDVFINITGKKTNGKDYVCIHLNANMLKIAKIIKNKTAELSQRRPRDAPNM